MRPDSSAQVRQCRDAHAPGRTDRAWLRSPSLCPPTRDRGVPLNQPERSTEQPDANRGDLAHPAVGESFPPDDSPGWTPEVDDRSPTGSDTAQQVHYRRIANDVARLRGLHTELAAEVTERLAPELAAMRQATNEQLAHHHIQLQLLMRTMQEQLNPPVDWHRLSAETARAEWQALAGWVEEVLVGWYELTRAELPDCWPLHRPVVVELSWLRTAHREAYLPSASGHLAADWHTRWRPAVLARIQQLVPSWGARSCSPGEHLVAEHERTPPPPPVPGTRAMPPSEQLAERRHWQPFYSQALDLDLRWRAHRDAGERTEPT